MGTPFEGSTPAAAAAGEQPAGAGMVGEIDLEPDIDEEEDEPASSDALSPDAGEAAPSSPVPAPPEPAYVVDPFQSPPSPDVSAKVPHTGGKSPAQPAADPAPADQPPPPQSHEPSSESGT